MIRVRYLAKAWFGMLWRKLPSAADDSKEAFEWYRKAAEQGDTKAQTVLGALYGIGKGVPRDDKKSAEWFAKAAERGDAEAQCNLGLIYYEGKGIPQDYEKSFEWFTKAAEQGYAEAQYNLAVMYGNGEGIPRDYKKSAEWFRKADEQGSSEKNERLSKLSKLMEYRARTAQEKNSTEKHDVDVLYEKLWREGLCEIVSETAAKEIATELLIPDRIDSFAFAHNYARFLRRGTPSFEDFFLNEEQSHCTASITQASSPLEYIPAFPDWFIAAYPDVFLWYGNVQDERVKSRKADEDVDDVMVDLICDLFGINPEDKNLGTDEIYDSEHKWLPKWLKNIVSSYKRQTGKKPETSVDETNNNAIKEFYENVDVVAAMAKSGLDNFTLIARKTTMYYLELSKNYGHRFTSETHLLAAAGVFDAQVYIFLKEDIEISEIVELAEKAIADEGDFLTEFIVGLEAKILAVDTPELPPELVTSSCQEEKPRIHEEIQRVQKDYRPDEFITKEVRAFMESPNFSEMREQLGIG